jgi:hypothetical protein
VTVPLFNAAGILQVSPDGDMALARDPNANPLGRPTLGGLPATPVPADFDQRFRAAFGHAPQASGEQGYRAMAGIIAAVAKATPGNSRDAVVKAFGL